MSRKIIRDFIKQADKLDNDQAARYFDTIMEVYEDCVHTANERVATLESDTLWLLVEYRRIVEAKDNTPEEKQQHRMAQGNLWQLLSVLIASTADKGIYLSEAFIKKYENVDFVGIPFGKYVRECYNVRKWHTPEPQQKHTEATQQPIGGNSGELAGNGNEKAPEGSKYHFPLWDDLKDSDKKLFNCQYDYNILIELCKKNQPTLKEVAEYYIDTIHNIDFDNNWGGKKRLHNLFKEWGVVKVKYEQFNRVLNEEMRA